MVQIIKTNDRHELLRRNNQTVFQSLNRKGMAIVIVLILSTALLIFGTSYISHFRNVQSVNQRLLERVQIDFWAQGVMQKAILKFKRLPSEFYFAYKACILDKRTFSSPTPWDVYLSDLAATITLPFSLSYSTKFTVLGQKKFEKDSICIEVEALQGNINHHIRQTINAERIKN
ncbi:MAG: hypothetical protein HQM08_00975 [Candidatus Riflebacteria bacterium]|nr:hypothetical protein [Candidatus Riflebacteria bacterium]